jgi:hypothetical protein
VTDTTDIELLVPTPAHRVRIISEGAPSGTDVLIDGASVANHVTAIDWHLDTDGSASARITFAGVELDGIAEGTATIGDHPAETAAENMTDVRDQLDELTNDVTALREQLAGVVQQLTQLTIQTALACATCYTEERTGTRTGHNLANVTIDGTGYCHEHVDLVNGRLVPKKTSGLIITGG